MLPKLDIVIPVHNEADTVGGVLRELIAELQTFVDPRVIVCEDGSSDGTSRVVQELAAELPIELLSQAERSGYAGAMLRGLKAAQTPWVLSMDGDGQCDPLSVRRLWAAGSDEVDVVAGVRSPRRDDWSRRAMSQAFGQFHDLLFRTGRADPSSPFVLLRRASVQAWLRELGELDYAFWWEFSAAAKRHRSRVVEVPIVHRKRVSGSSRAFPLRSVASIGVSHVWGMVKLHRRFR